MFRSARSLQTGNVIRPDLLSAIQTPASEDSGQCRHLVTFRWPCLVLEADGLVAPFQASWPAVSEPSEGLLGQASALAREGCLAGLAPAARSLTCRSSSARATISNPAISRGKQVSIDEAPARGRCGQSGLRGCLA